MVGVGVELGLVVDEDDGVAVVGKGVSWAVDGGGCELDVIFVILVMAT